MSRLGYIENLKQVLVGRPDAPFVWLCNFEVETQWARNYVGLPAANLSATNATVQRMEELGALLAAPTDHVIVSHGLDAGFRDYAQEIGFPLPTELVPEVAVEGSTTESVLASPELLRELTALAAEGAYLMPMGVSDLEQRVAEVTGLRLAVPDSKTFEKVNGKIYSRRLVDELGLKSIPGHCAETVAELRSALDTAFTPERPVIVKDSFGVSGKGLIVLDSEKKVTRLLRMVDRRAERKGEDRLDVVVEHFLAKRFDLNYQLTISRSGEVTLDFVKEALTQGGVHKGHIMPPDLNEAQVEEIREAAARIGAELFRDGFTGVVGVDALVSDEDVVYPVLEINARLNMSTYQGRVTERYRAEGAVALAKHFSLRLTEPLPFADLLDGLGSLADAPENGRGMVMTCFGTVNAQSGTDAFDGRLYAVLFGSDRADLLALDEEIAAALENIRQVGSVA